MDGFNSRMEEAKEIMMNLKKEWKNPQFEQHKENRLKLTKSQ